MVAMKFKIKGNLVDAFKREIYPAEISIQDTKIESIRRIDEELSDYILPGLVDSHVHIESSMLVPAEFAKLAIRFGTVAVVSDPHEIANVAGVDGVNFMIKNSKTVPLKFFFGAPSCVPATRFESSGASLNASQIEELLKREEIYFLSEVMNFPGVINGDPELLRKIDIAAKYNKPVDGHAPGLTGDDLKKYIDSGITTDHESISIAEAEEKILRGMKVMIREGSAAKGFDLFHKLIDAYPGFVMLCTDDIHPDDLINGHINLLLARGVRLGVDVYNLVRAASINPVLHYNLPVGLLREGDRADIVVVKDIEGFEVLETYIEGVKLFGKGEVLFESEAHYLPSRFREAHLSTGDLNVRQEGERIRVIEARDGELYTRSIIKKPLIINDCAVSDTERDILKIVVVNKYSNAKPVTAFITGFGLKKGAIAGSIAHDSHNIIAVGVEDADIASSINSVIDMKGGLVIADSGTITGLKLEIAGLMTTQDGYDIALKYNELDQLAKKLGCELTAPFMSLSFMALLVIPELKISDLGLFDSSAFNFTSLFVE